ncbi:hypothetical protein E4U53_002714 [Claviceps sorghi]|nr:hypothetical protein E4U53_002714 [Claviceps sorghi]
MKFAAAIVAAAAVGANAHWKNNATVHYTTEVVDKYVTYCPGAMAVTHGGQVYTVTEPTTLTITNCPCTITRPVLTTSTVICNTGACAVPTATGAVPTGPGVVPTGGSTATPSGPHPTSGAGKAAGLSGAGLAGAVGLAALLL